MITHLPIKIGAVDMLTDSKIDQSFHVYASFKWVGTAC